MRLLFFGVTFFLFASCSENESGCIRSAIQKKFVPEVIEVDLPKPEKENTYNEQLEIFIDSLDHYYFQGSQLTIEQIEAQLVQKLEGVKEPAISVRTHEESSSGALMKVINLAKKNGWKCALAMKNPN